MSKSGDPPPVNIAEKIDRICDHFESKWQSGKRPSIKTYLAKAEQSRYRPQLFRAIVLLDIEYRQKAGEMPAASEYSSRFPDLRNVVQEVFDSVETLGVGNISEESRSVLDNTTSSQADLGVGSQLREYLLTGELGRGAFGVVYRARHERLDRDVAIKIPKTNLLVGKEERERFLREARSAAQLQHPNIVPVYDAGRTGNTYYIVSGLIEGTTLKEQLDAGRLIAQREAVDIMIWLASALHYAHIKGIIHRDVKPANIMLDARDEPHVMDFGLARRDEGDVLRTREGLQIGTPAYMSPEQHAGMSHLADARSDMWSIGVIFYELLTGQRPFQGTSAVQIGTAIRTQEPTWPSKLDPSIDKDLETICLKCLNKDPEGRYASCQHLVDDLNRWLSFEPISARRITTPERFSRWCRRNPSIALLASSLGMMLVLLVTVFAFAYFQTSHSLRNAEEQRRRADRSADLEAAARARADAAVQRELTLRREAERSSYRALIPLAYNAWHEGNPSYAKHCISECSEYWRHWEWRYLDNLFKNVPPTRDSDKTIFKAEFVGIDTLFTAIESEPIVKVWKINSAQDPVSWILPGLRVLDMDVSDDGNLVAASSSDSVVEIWDIKEQKVVTTLKGQCCKIAIHPDNQRIAVSDGKEHQIIIKRIDTGEPQKTFAGPRNLKALTFFPDGRLVAAGGDDRVSVFGSQDSKDTVSFPTNMRFRIECFAVCSTDNIIATGHTHGIIKLWDATTGSSMLTLSAHVGKVESLEFSPDGKVLLSSGSDNLARVWDVKDGILKDTLIGHNHAVHCAVFSEGQELIATGSEYGFKVWDLEETSIDGTISVPGSQGVFSEDGLRFATLDGPGTMRIFDTHNWTEVSSLDGIIGIPLFGKNSDEIIVIGRYSITCWDVASGNQRFEHSFPHALRVDLSDDGDFVFVRDKDESMSIRHADSGLEVKSLASHCKSAIEVALCKDSSLTAIIGQEGDVKVVRTADGEIIANLGFIKDVRRRAAHLPISARIAFNPNNSQLAVGDHREINVFDINGQKELCRLGPTAGGAITFGPDGSRVYSLDYDTTRVWNVESGESQHLGAHRSGVFDLAFSSDGLRVASVSGDRTLRIFEERTGQQLLAIQLAGQMNPLNVTFSPDGRFVSLSQDGSTKVFIAADQ